MKQSDYLTPAETALVMGVTLRTIYTWLRSEKLPGTKIGGSWRVDRKALEVSLNGAPKSAQFRAVSECGRSSE